MALDRDPNHVFRDFVTAGLPSSGKHHPRKPEIRQLLTEWWQTLIALVADAGGLELPNLLIRYEVVGGDENDITAEANLPVPEGPGVAVFSIVIEEANTGPVTINGKPLLSNTGNPLVAGALAADGIYLFLDNGDSYRLLSDYVSSSIVAAAEAAADRAEAAAATASGVSAVADRTALKALDTTTKKTAVIYGEAGSDGRFVFRSGDYSAHVAADPLEAYFIKADEVAATSGAWVREDGQAVAGFRVDRFGAVADGDGEGSGTDYSAALQAAIDLADVVGGFVSIPYIGTGIYRWLNQIEMKSDVTVRVAPHVAFDNKGSSAPILVSFKGTVGNAFAFGGNRVRGQKNVVPLIPASGGTYDGSISPGDLIHIVSQRNALSSDAGRWRCGNGTAGAPYAYFAEFHVVKDVTGSNNNILGLQSGILFPSYRVDATQETDSDALPAATIKKVNPCRNSHWIGGKFISTEDTNYLFQSEWAADCTVSNVLAYRGTRTGRTIRWTASLRCRAIEVTTWNDPTLEWDYSTYHGLLNRYMTAGTQDCGFIRCEDYFGGQSFDFAYSAAAPFVSVRTYMEECATYNSFEQGVTTHPGCFQTRVSNCRFIDCYEDGILFRGLQDKAFNNTITANAEMNADGTGYASAGIAYYDGHAKGGRCEGNDIFGFRYAYYVNDGGSSEQHFTEIDLAIRGGTVQDCHYGLFTNLSASNTYYKSRKISMDGVKGLGIGRYLMQLGNNMPGCAMVNCELSGPFTDTTANSKGLFSAYNNCPGQVVLHNRCYDMGAGAAGSTFIVVIGSVTDTTNFPSATWTNKTKIRDNFVIGGVDTTFSVNNTVYTQTDGTPS